MSREVAIVECNNPDSHSSPLAGDYATRITQPASVASEREKLCPLLAVPRHAVSSPPSARKPPENRRTTSCRRGREGGCFGGKPIVGVIMLSRPALQRAADALKAPSDFHVKRNAFGLTNCPYWFSGTPKFDSARVQAQQASAAGTAHRAEPPFRHEPFVRTTVKPPPALPYIPIRSQSETSAHLRMDVTPRRPPNSHSGM